MHKLQFYYCKDCDLLLGTVKGEKDVTLTCCGKTVEKLIPNTVDAAQEKHVPVITKANGKVTVRVGAVTHPMLAEHYIEWIALAGGNTTLRQSFEPGEEPVLTVEDWGVTEAFAYCNLHGLWKGEV